MNPRAEFWSWVQDKLREPDALAALEAIKSRVLEEQETLLAAPPTSPTENNRDWIGGLRGEGPQAFFLPWRAGTNTGAHAHPNRMLVIVLRGELEMTNYERGATVLVDRQRVRAGEYVFGVSDDPGYENFPHAIAAVEDSLSFHLYGDDPARGRRYPDAPR